MKHSSRCGAGAALFLALLLSAACRQVEVDGQTPSPGPGTGKDAGGSNLIGGIDQGNADGGSPPPTGGAGPAGGAGGGTPVGGGGGGGGVGGAMPDGGVVVPADAGMTAGPAAITDLRVLVAGLNAINVPAVGADGVSLLQYAGSGAAVDLKVKWDGTVINWFEPTHARYLYAAAAGTHHVALVYGATSYGIYENGGAVELSGAPATYKEFLAASDAGFAWIDYGEIKGHNPGSPGGPGMPAGKVMFQPWGGAPAAVTDTLRYRARPELGAGRVAFVEYASTTPGSPGQIVVQPLAGGPAVPAAPSAHHQDRPALSGDWVVWEEYVGSTDAVIRARNLVTGDVRALSSATGFRTSPHIRGTRVTWEDQRAGNGDIYFNELSGTAGERVAVSGPGHSAGARLTENGLVWIESNGGTIGLLYARWVP